MKTYFNKFGFAVLSVSMVICYFLLTGGVMVSRPGPPKFISLTTSLTAPDVGIQTTLSYTVQDTAELDTREESICVPPVQIQTVRNPVNPPVAPYAEYAVRKGSPGVGKVNNWAYLDAATNIGDRQYKFERKVTFNEAGQYTIYVRSSTYRYAGSSENRVDSIKVNVGGNPPLPPGSKKYTFQNLEASYLEDPIGTAKHKITFTDPANQYFAVKPDDKIDFVFKWTPSAQDRQKVPELETSYDVRDFDKIYSVLREVQGGGGIWYYEIIYDNTRKVSFAFFDLGNICYLRATKQTQNKTLILDFEFQK